MKKESNPNPPKNAVKPTPPPAPPLREFKTVFLSELVETSKSKRDTEQWRSSMNKSVPKAVLWGYRQVGQNYPSLRGRASFDIFKDVMRDKVNALNLLSQQPKYEIIKITITLEE